MRARNRQSSHLQLAEFGKHALHPSRPESKAAGRLSMRPEVQFATVDQTLIRLCTGGPIRLDHGQRSEDYKKKSSSLFLLVNRSGRLTRQKP